MTNYYIEENGEIKQTSHVKFDDNCIETEEGIVSFDNKFMLQSDYDEYINSDGYKAEQEQKRLDNFNAEFFETSIGFVRRKVFIKGTGETGDFLKDFLSQLLIAFMSGRDIQAIIYDKPPMTADVTDWEQYQKTIVWDKATQQTFLNECSYQSQIDFFGA